MSYGVLRQQKAGVMTKGAVNVNVNVNSRFV